jgi:3-phenylpropionate/cinnamic acid dioxygenase small subunit
MPVDALAVQQLMLRYADAIDADDIEAWPDFFTADGEYTVISRDSLRRGHRIGIMQCFGQGMMRDRVMGLRDANVYEPHGYRHVVSAPLLGDSGATGVEASASFLLARIMRAGVPELFLSGRYEDLVVATADGPRFKRRRVVLDSTAIDTLLVIPV